MFRTSPSPSGLLCLLLCCVVAHAGENTLNIDDLERKRIQLPDGSSLEVIIYNEKPWRVTEPSVLASTDIRNPDVCFEAKFDSFQAPDKLRLFGQQGVVILSDERLRRKAQSDFKRNDNLWVCGPLRRAASGKYLELVAVELVKQPPDAQKFEARIAKLEEEKAADSLIELGNLIESQVRGVLVITDHDKLRALRKKAFDIGLRLKEEVLRPDDAQSHFALALQYRDLAARRNKFHELVRKALTIDPDFANAARVAEEELDLVKFEGKWISKTDKARVDKERKDDEIRRNAAATAANEAKNRERLKAAGERQGLMAQHLAALRGNDGPGRSQAIQALADAAQKSPDPGFGEEAVDIFVNLNDPSAVSPGLELLTASEHAEVRKLAYEALAWRAGADATAVNVLAAAIAKESDAPTGKAALEATRTLPAKQAAGILVGALGNADRALRDEAMEGLRAVTKQSFASKEEWANWWSQNKGSFNP